jgi:hypothetical protein
VVNIKSIHSKARRAGETGAARFWSGKKEDQIGQELPAR